MWGYGCRLEQNSRSLESWAWHCRSPTANAEFEAALGRLWRLPANELRSQAARLRYYQESGQPPQQLNTNLVRVLKVAAAIEYATRLIIILNP